MSTSLYVLSGDYLAAANKLSDSDLPENVIEDTLEGLAGEVEEKATNVAMLVRNLEATAASIRDAERKMADRRKAIESKADQIRKYLKENMQRCGITKIESPYFTLAIKKNPPSVIIDDAFMIPAEYMSTPTPPPPAQDKKLIAQALKDGKKIEGAHIEHGERLEIK